MSKQSAKTWLNHVTGVGMLLYPLIAHFSVYFNKHYLAAAYLVILFILFLLSSKTTMIWPIRLVLISLIPGAIWLFSASAAPSLWIYLPPLLIPLWLSFVFFESLRHNEGSVVSRIAAMMENRELDADHLRYTRIVTVAWGSVLLMMAIEALLLAWLAPFIVWSWWVHIGNYIVIAVLFSVEMLYRWMRFRRSPALIRMVKILLKRPWQTQGGQ